MKKVIIASLLLITSVLASDTHDPMAEKLFEAVQESEQEYERHRRERAEEDYHNERVREHQYIRHELENINANLNRRGY